MSWFVLGTITFNDTDTVACKYCRTVRTKRLHISIKSFYCSVCAIQSYCPQNKAADLPLFYWRLVPSVVKGVAKYADIYRTLIHLFKPCWKLLTCAESGGGGPLRLFAYISKTATSAAVFCTPVLTSFSEYVVKIVGPGHSRSGHQVTSSDLTSEKSLNARHSYTDWPTDSSDRVALATVCFTCRHPSDRVALVAVRFTRRHPSDRVALAAVRFTCRHPSDRVAVASSLSRPEPGQGVPPARESGTAGRSAADCWLGPLVAGIPRGVCGASSRQTAARHQPADTIQPSAQQPTHNSNNSPVDSPTGENIYVSFGSQV